MEPMPSPIAGRYTIRTLLGQGGMGEVHLAWDERLNREVALKCVNAGKEVTPKRRRRQEREARAVAALSHPAIAQIYDIVEHEGRDWLVLEYIQGATLREVLGEGRMPVDRVLRIALQVAEGLAAAHEAGVLHRDLKAENVMISAGDRVRLLDFGLAKIRDDDDSLTEEGVVVGTLSSVSPEQAEGGDVDERSDLFSLGSMLYQMLSGRHPFKSDTATATLNNVVRLDPKPLRQVSPEVPVELAELVHGLLAKDPRRRPSSAREVQASLERLAGGGTASGTLSTAHLAVSHALRGRGRALRNAAFAAVGLIVVVAAVAIGMYWPGSEFEPLFVAVPEPAVALEVEGRDPGPVAQAILSAATNTLADLASVYPTEVDQEVLEDKGLATALQVAGASEAFAADLTPSAPGVWSVQLRRRAEPGNRVLWTDTLTVLEEELALVREAIRQAVVEGWGERPRVGGRSLDEVRPEDFRRFVDLLAREKSLPTETEIGEKLDELEAIRTSSPRFLDAYAEEVQVLCYAHELFVKNEYLERARTVLEVMRRQDENDMRTLRARKRVARLDRDEQELGRILALARRVAPAAPETLRIEATKAIAEGDLDRAVAVRERIVRLQPSAQNVVTLAATERVAGDPQRGLERLEAILAVDPDNPKALIERANILALTDPGAAAEIYADLLESGRRVDVSANWATVFLVTGQVERAAEVTRRAIEGGDRHPVTLLGLADCYNILGDRVQAMQWYQRVVDSVAPRRATASVDALAVEIQALAHLRHFDEASDRLEHLRATEPDNPMTLYAAILVHTLRGDLERARSLHARWSTTGLSEDWFDFPWFESTDWHPAD